MIGEYILLTIIGLIVLIVGAELAVRGSINLAKYYKISPFVVGAVLIAGGTSLPELASCLQAINWESPDIVFGNVIGSNMANILLVVGALALASPIILNTHTQQEIKSSNWVMILSTAILIVFCFIGTINQYFGFLLILLLLIFIFYLLKIKKFSIPTEESKISMPLTIFFVVGGIVGMIFGSYYFIEGSVKIAKFFEIDETIIGITVVAIGTSLPELTAGLVAIVKRNNDFAIGNIIGSNIYNILGILGISSLFGQGLVIPQLVVNREIWILLATSIIFVLIIKFYKKINRTIGLAFLTFYFIYLIFLL